VLHELGERRGVTSLPHCQPPSGCVSRPDRSSTR